MIHRIQELSNSKVEYQSKASHSTLPSLNLLHALHNTMDRRQCRHMTRKWKYKNMQSVR